MNYSIGRSRICKFLISLMIIGVILGIILYLNLDKTNKENLITELSKIFINIDTTKQNNIFYHLSIIFICSLSSLTLIIYPINILFLLYEMVSSGFILAMFTSLNGFHGLMYGLLYLILNKALFILVIFYLNIISLKLVNLIVNSIMKKNNISVQELYVSYFKKVCLSLSFILLIDIFIYFFGNKILSIFNFLL